MERTPHRSPRAVGRPGAALRGLLGDYVGIVGADADPPLVRPAGTTVPLVVKVSDSAHRPPAFLHGPSPASEAMVGPCAPAFLTVELAPLGAYTLLGAPVDELGGSLVDLEDLFGPDGRRLAEQVRTAPSWPRRFAVLDRFLARRAADGPRPAPEVERAWRLIVAGAGRIPIGAVARDVGWSHRHLIARFRQQVGLNPKTAARLVRFEAVLARLRERPASWARLAAEAGYADQAHLARDFRTFTGRTPTTFVSPRVCSGADDRAAADPADPWASPRSGPRSETDPR